MIYRQRDLGTFAIGPRSSNESWIQMGSAPVAKRCGRLGALLGGARVASLLPEEFALEQEVVVELLALLEGEFARALVAIHL